MQLLTIELCPFIESYRLTGIKSFTGAKTLRLGSWIQKKSGFYSAEGGCYFVQDRCHLHSSWCLLVLHAFPCELRNNSLSVCLSVSVPVSLSLCLCLCLSVSLSVCLSLSLSLAPLSLILSLSSSPIFLSSFPNLCRSLSMFLSSFLSFSPFLSLTAFLLRSFFHTSPSLCLWCFVSRFRH